MNLLKDMELFVKVVHCNGLATAAREFGITPSSVTTRIKNLEKHYQVKLLSRNTRSFNLTHHGQVFYKDCLQTLADIQKVEIKLQSGQEKIAGPLRISATSDLGRQYIAPILKSYVQKYPEVQPFLNLSDSVTDLTEHNLDVAIRYGIAADDSLIARKLASSRRVICASPAYLERYGIPQTISDLTSHLCLSMVQSGRSLQTWYFDTPGGEKSLKIAPSQSCDDGAQVRQWAIEGAGLALKSIWDVASDISAGRLVTVLDGFSPNYQSSKSNIDSDLYVVYQDRNYMANRTREFISFLRDYFESHEHMKLI